MWLQHCKILPTTGHVRLEICFSFIFINEQIAEPTKIWHKLHTLHLTLVPWKGDVIQISCSHSLHQCCNKMTVTRPCDLLTCPFRQLSMNIKNSWSRKNKLSMSAFLSDKAHSTRPHDAINYWTDKIVIVDW